MMGPVERRTLIRLVLLFMLLVAGEALAIRDTDAVPAYASKLVSEVADTLVEKSGWNKDSLRISSIDMKDAKLGETVMYEFHIEVGGVLIPIILQQEVTDWRFLEDLESKDAAGKSAEHQTGEGKSEEGSAENAMQSWDPKYVSPTLSPFRLAGPVDLWVQDADKLRLAMPNDVDAGILKRVLIADGAAVTVEGAREVSLTRPLKLPLPLQENPDNEDLASALLNLASRLRLASRSEEKPLLSMRIVGPSTLVATASEESDTVGAGLKVKRLSPSAVELVSRKEIVPVGPSDNPLDEATSWLWPLASLNGSASELVTIERALMTFLGPQAYKPGSVNLLKAKAAVTNLVKISFELERPVTNESSAFQRWPEWAERPSLERMQFEVLAKVEGGELLPISVNRVKSGPYLTVTASWGHLTGNQTMGLYTPFLGTIDPMTLDVDWDNIV